MKTTISQIEGTNEWQAKVGKLSKDEYFLLVSGSHRAVADLDKLKSRLRKEIVEEAGGAIRTIANGKIGNGKKVHRLTITYMELTDFRGKGIFYLTAQDGCGSSKWNCWSPSALYVLGEHDNEQVTCIKCRPELAVEKDPKLYNGPKHHLISMRDVRKNEKGGITYRKGQGAACGIRRVWNYFKISEFSKMAKEHPERCCSGCLREFKRIKEALKK